MSHRISAVGVDRKFENAVAHRLPPGDSMTGAFQALTFAILMALALPLAAAAQVAPERLCDTQFEDCRQPIIDLIRSEQIGIDVAFWYMQDSRYLNEIVNRYNAGVP